MKGERGMRAREVAKAMAEALANLARVVAKTDRDLMNTHLAEHGLKLVPLRPQVVDVQRRRR